MAREIIYSVYKDGKYIGDYRSSDIRKELSLSRQAFYKAMRKQETIRGHYKLVPVDEVVNKRDYMFTEFDATTETLKKQIAKRKDKYAL